MLGPLHKLLRDKPKFSPKSTNNHISLNTYTIVMFIEKCVFVRHSAAENIQPVLEHNPVLVLCRGYALAPVQCCHKRVSSVPSSASAPASWALDWRNQQHQCTGTTAPVSSAAHVPVEHQRSSISTGPRWGRARYIMGRCSEQRQLVTYDGCNAKS